MNIGLIDVDSIIPNLALMKISAFYKEKGNSVELTSPLFSNQFDFIYASKIFTYSALPSINTLHNVGGSGFMIHIKLPGEIEGMMPDYSIYPKSNYSMGFTSRGCPRKCKFCIVKEKEGNCNAVADIYKFWDKRHKKITLLDNNIFSIPGHFEKISGQILKEGLKVDFLAGLDIRFLNKTKANLLSKMKSCSAGGYWRFAFDSLRYEKSFRKGAEILLEKLSPKKVQIFILAGFDEDLDQTLRRFQIATKEYGFDPYVMLYISPNGSKAMGNRLADLERWSNRFIYKSVPFDEYDFRLQRKGNI